MPPLHFNTYLFLKYRGKPKWLPACLLFVLLSCVDSSFVAVFQRNSCVPSGACGLTAQLLVF